MKCLHFKTGCMTKPSSLMQIPSKRTKERHRHIGKSFCSFINNALKFCSYKALGFPVAKTGRRCWASTDFHGNNCWSSERKHTILNDGNEK